MISAYYIFIYLRSFMVSTSRIAIKPCLPLIARYPPLIYLILLIPLVMTRFLGPILISLPSIIPKLTLLDAYLSDISIFGTAIQELIIRTKHKIIVLSDLTRLDQSLSHLNHQQTTVKFYISMRHINTLFTNIMTKKLESLFENLIPFTIP